MGFTDLTTDAMLLLGNVRDLLQYMDLGAQYVM